MSTQTSLPRIADVERLSTSIIRILGGNPSKFSLQGTNTYLIGSPQTRSRILIDTAQGFPIWTQHLSSVLEQENATVSTCLLTHYHHDHIGGINDLRKLCPDVKIWKHSPSLWDGPEQDHRLHRGEGEERPPLGPKLQDLDVSGVQAIEDGMTFTTEDGGVTLRAVYTPGHTDDHCCFVIDSSADETPVGSIFTGDNVLGHGTSVFTNLPLYMSSLTKMLHQIPNPPSPAVAYPAHGALVPSAHTTISSYITHRQTRENEILAAFPSLSSSSTSTSPASTSTTAPAIVKIVYKDVPESLHAAAERGVRQVLEKLEGEGRVGRKIKGNREGEEDDDEEWWELIV